MDKKILALIPARAGSLRVPGKNIRPLAGHPLIAYTITVARASNLFERIIVSTNSEVTRDIAIYYGAEAPFLRPNKFATSTSPDIEWLKHALSRLEEKYDCFAILRPTSPFRSVETIKRALEGFLKRPNIDSLRAVELCHEHPGKMWVVEKNLIRPFLDQSHLEVAWHDGQYQALPKVYVQNSSLEIAWTRVVWEDNSRGGKVIMPFFAEGREGFTIDYESDWYLAEHMIETGEAALPLIDKKPFIPSKTEKM